MYICTCCRRDRPNQAVDDPAGLRDVERGLRWIAEVQAGYQQTGILGEAWYARDGRVFSVVGQPHVWEQVLFYLAALETCGREPYAPGTSVAADRTNR